MLKKGILRRHDINYNFIGDYNTGITARWGKEFNENPAMAPFPELADVSISNLCNKGCDFCYKDSTSNGKLMDFESYKYVLDELTSRKWGPVFQIALGGGEPSEHPEIIRILEETNKREIIPNLTTNARVFSKKLLKAYKKYCGAVAVSISEIDQNFIRSNIKPFLNAGIKTNIHYLLTKGSISQAIEILKGKWDENLSRINAIIFLTHKSMGRAKRNNNLVWNVDLIEFINNIDSRKSMINMGFDSCFVPLLFRYTNSDPILLDSCECGFFSVYIDEDLNVKPCSFTTHKNYSYNLDKFDFESIWNYKFNDYRIKMKDLCNLKCEYHNICKGGCFFHPYLNMCY